MAKKRNTNKAAYRMSTIIFIFFLALLIVILSILAIFQLGIIGKVLHNTGRFLVGEWIVILLIFIMLATLWFLFGKTKINIKNNHIISFILLGFSTSVLLTLLHYQNIKGTAFVDAFFQDMDNIFNQQGYSSGGILGMLGALLFTALFDRIGAFLVLALLVIVAIVIFQLQKSTTTITEMLDKKETINVEDIKVPTFKVFNIKRPKKEILDYEAIQKEVADESEVLSATDEQDFAIEPLDLDLSPLEVAKHLKTTDAALPTEPMTLAETVLPQNRTLPKSEAPVAAVTKGHKNSKSYQLPPLSLLEKSGTNEKQAQNNKYIQSKSELLLGILNQFGIGAQLINTYIGPSVTKFELKLDAGIKVSKLVSLQDNIMMELAVKNLRIEAPIPGKNAVGIEIPNLQKQPVRMLELLKTVPLKYRDSELLLALGKNLMGETIYCELNKMPHLLVAGATGSGKSVCINGMIMTMLLRSHPDRLKLILIDPKKVEFTPYADIPHLAAPIVTDAQQAAQVLANVVSNMESRYELFAQHGVRNFAAYNEKVAKDNSLEILPALVVIIDELADLMLVAAKEVEAAIQRITQLARAAGIHLIVATQRPSVDVITGVIKSNIPSRIAFAVSSGIDSRTILDTTGAERLLGSGDMLYMPIGEPAPMRLQGVYVSDQEIQAVSAFARNQSKPTFDEQLLDAMQENETLDNNDMLDKDELYEEVKEFVIYAQKASTSLLQRRFGIGYNRAARMIDMLELEGVIGPQQGSKPRDVYIKKEDHENGISQL